MKVNDCCLGFIVSVQRTKRAAPFHQVECLKKSTTGLHFICFFAQRDGSGQIRMWTAFSPFEECS